MPKKRFLKFSCEHTVLVRSPFEQRTDVLCKPKSNAKAHMFMDNFATLSPAHRVAAIKTMQVQLDKLRASVFASIKEANSALEGPYAVWLKTATEQERCAVPLVAIYAAA